jgi:hypothetical protein
MIAEMRSLFRRRVARGWISISQLGSSFLALLGANVLEQSLGCLAGTSHSDGCLLRSLAFGALKVLRSISRSATIESAHS